MKQFDVCPVRSGTLVVLVQSDLLDAIATRVAVPLATRGAASTLRPRIVLGDDAFVLRTTEIAVVETRSLLPAIGNVGEQRDAIVRAIDALLSGV